jgi:glutamate racemase
LSEEGWVKKPLTRMIVKKYLHPLKVRRIDTLILGNPHYTLLAPVIQAKIGRRVRIVDSVACALTRFRCYLTALPDLDRTLPKSGRIRLVFTDLTPQVVKAVDHILKRSLPLESSADIRQLPA